MGLRSLRESALVGFGLQEALRRSTFFGSNGSVVTAARRTNAVRTPPVLRAGQDRAPRRRSPSKIFDAIRAPHTALGPWTAHADTSRDVLVSRLFAMNEGAR
jgi:hypothetical protein